MQRPSLRHYRTPKLRKTPKTRKTPKCILNQGPKSPMSPPRGVPAFLLLRDSLLQPLPAELEGRTDAEKAKLAFSNAQRVPSYASAPLDIGSDMIETTLASETSQLDNFGPLTPLQLSLRKIKPRQFLPTSGTGELSLFPSATNDCLLSDGACLTGNNPYCVRCWKKGPQLVCAKCSASYHLRCIDLRM